MQALVRRLKPTRFEDISALLALYRPGPLGMDMHIAFADRKNGVEEVTFDHPDLEPILGETHGVIVYQEQVMQIATDLCGFSMAEADALRKAVGKKIRELMEAQKEQFVAGGVANGYERVHRQPVGSDREVRRVRLQQVPHRRLRGRQLPDRLAQGPLPGRVHGGAVDQREEQQGQQAAVPQRVPADGHPGATRRTSTSPVRTSPRVATRSCSGCPPCAASGRGSSSRSSPPVGHGPLRGLPRLLRQGRRQVLNKRTLENLILAGAFASLGHTRKGLVAAYEPIVDAAQTRKKAEAAGQFSLFDDMGDADRRPRDVVLDDAIAIAP
jgi:DNA polymerase III subunit alpha